MTDHEQVQRIRMYEEYLCTRVHRTTITSDVFSQTALKTVQMPTSVTILTRIGSVLVISDERIVL
jgi:hypothetical protein